MSPTLGEKLKTAREQRGISISEVAEQTRISPLYLEAIDSDNYKTLPGGIFNKGFVRSYAKYVGVDEQEALQDYSRLMAAQSMPTVEEEFKAYRPEVLTDDRAASSIVPTVIFAAVILGLMTAGILFLVNYIQNQQSDPQLAANTVTTNSANVTANTANANTAAPASVAPGMGSVKVEFGAQGDEIWLQSFVDGRRSDAMVKAGENVVFEPKESVSLKYAKSRAQFAQLKLNGKAIALPQQPERPNQPMIEINVTQGNLAQIFDSGQFTFGSASAEVPGTEAQPAVTPRLPARPPANRTPRPANVNSAAPPEAPTMRPVSTPAAARPAANGQER
jgi:cytoskeleton protein RodZ